MDFFLRVKLEEILTTANINLPANAGDIPDVASIVGWRRAWQPTLVFLPEESHGQRSLVGYIHSIGSKRVRHDRSNFAHTLV